MVVTRSQSLAQAQTQTQMPHAACSIHRLNDEVLLLVFDLLHATQRSAVLAASSVCRSWHGLAQRVIDNTIGPLILGCRDETRNHNLFARLKASEQFQNRVNHFVVGDWFLHEIDLQRHDRTALRVDDPYSRGGYFSETWSERERHEDETWPQVVALIDAISAFHLASFTWGAIPSMPVRLSQALANQPACRISIVSNVASVDDAMVHYTPYLNKVTLSTLSCFHNSLITLEAIVPAGDSKLLHSLGAFVRQADNLRCLSIYAVGRIWPERLVPTAHVGTALDRFSTVTDMRWLSGEGVASTPLPLKRIQLTNFCVCDSPGSSQAWTDCVSWSRLQELGLSCATMFRRIQRELRELSHLSLQLTSGRDCEFSMCPSRLTSAELATVLSKNADMRHLSITNGTELLTASLVQHLPRALRSLHTHEITLPVLPTPYRPILTARMLKLLGEKLSFIHDLALDVPFADSEYLGYVRFILTQFTSLKELTVFREAEQKGADRAQPPRGPVTNHSIAKDFGEHVLAVSPSLCAFHVHVTSVPPFDRDRWYAERSSNPFVYGTVDPRHFIARRLTPMSLDVALMTETRCLQVDRAKKMMESGVRHYERTYARLKRLAEHCWNYYWEPPQ